MSAGKINLYKALLLAYIICSNLLTFSQSPKKGVESLGPNPVLFLDSVRVDREKLMAIKPEDVVVVNIKKGKEAFDLAGDSAKDGIFFVITKNYAKENYWKYFKSKSEIYSQLVSSPHADSTVQYIVNKRLLKGNFEGTLFLIDDKVFKKITMLDSTTLAEKYSVTDKRIGFKIKSKVPKNLYHGRRTF